MIQLIPKSLAWFCFIFFTDLESALLLSCEREHLWNMDFEKSSTARRGRSVYSRIRKELFYIIHLACTLEQLLLSWPHTNLTLFSCVAGCTRASSQGMTGSHGSSLAKMLGADTPLSLARTWSVLRQVRIRQREKWVFWYRCRQFRQPIRFASHFSRKLLASVFQFSSREACDLHNLYNFEEKQLLILNLAALHYLCLFLFACPTTLLGKYNHSISTNIYS